MHVGPRYRVASETRQRISDSELDESKQRELKAAIQTRRAPALPYAVCTERTADHLLGAVAFGSAMLLVFASDVFRWLVGYHISCPLFFGANPRARSLLAFQTRATVCNSTAACGRIGSKIGWSPLATFGRSTI